MTRRTPRLTRVRALLAGGLVLGVGAGVTLAAWTAQEHATGTFAASRFGTLSSADGGATWTDNSTTAAVLSLSPAALTPGDVTAASFGIRATAASVAGTVTVQTPTVGTGALTPYLRYRMYGGASSTCTTTSTPSGRTGWVVGDGSTWIALTAAVPANSTALAAAGASSDGAPVWFCFQVRLADDAPNSLQGSSTAATWQFLAASS